MLRKLHVYLWLTFTCLALIRVNAHGQEFSLYNIVTDSFPTISANYVAIDPTGKAIDDLAARDFRVIESTLDGRSSDLSPTVTHSCITNSTASAVSVVLVVDESNSMDNVLPSGKRRIDYVKDALRAFVERLPWNGETAVCLIGFSGRSRLLCDWQTTPGGVLSAIGRLTPQTATNYEVSFLGIPNCFDQLSSRSAEIPKVVFFVTDGAPNPDIDNRRRFEDTVRRKCNEQGVRLFSATLMINRTDPSIAFLCKATGGRSLIATEETLVDLAAVLSFEITSRKVCKISWISPMVCSDALRERTATVQLRRGRAPEVPVTYTTPDSSVYLLTAEPPAVVFGDVPPLQSSELDVVITARNGDFSITSASVSTPAHFQLVGFRPFTLRKGEQRSVRVRFTQGAGKSIHQGLLTFTGTPSCLPTVTLVGGGGSIILTTPNGGEVLSTCDTTVVQWTGVGPEQLVRLEYSCDGTSWTLIADSVSGSKYSWLPDAGCPTARIRVRTVAGERLLWTQRLGATGRETATSVSASPSGLRSYATGTFVGQTTIGAVSANAALGAPDGYLTEFDSDGAFVKTTLLRGDIGAIERITAVRTDEDGNIYLVGTSNSSTTTFGSDTWSKGPIDEQVGVFYKLRADGSILNRLVFGGTDLDGADVNILALDVRLDPDGRPEAVVYGTVENIISARGLSGVVFDERDIPNTGAWAFTTFITESGFVRIAVSPDQLVLPPVDPFVAEDRAGYRYRTGSFEGQFVVPLLPPVTLESKGQSDVWVAKSAIGITTSDVSDRTFQVLQPRLTTTISEITFDSTSLGRTSARANYKVLVNVGTAPVFIDSAVISGIHAEDFTLVDHIAESTIDTGSAASVEVLFSPRGIGKRTAVLTIYGACNNILAIPLSGEGRPECGWTVQDTTDMGQHIIGSVASQTFRCVIRSNRPLPLRGIVSLAGSTDFRVSPTGVFTLRTGECLDVRVTYTPTQPGVQVAQIMFNLPTECGTAFTTLFAEGIIPDVSVNNLDLGDHRLGTRVMDSVTISNNGTVDVTITDISVQDTAFSALDIRTPSTPLVVPRGSTRSIPVTFSPVVRGPVRARVLFRANGIDSTRVSTITGNGYQPVIEARGYSFAPTLVGAVSSERGYVRIWNRDTLWPLTIVQMSLAATTEFDIVSTPPPQFVIDPLDSFDVEVQFRPSVPGMRRTAYTIVHDGIPGYIPPYATTTVPIDGIALQRSVLSPVTFDTLLECLSDTAFITLVNDDPLQPISITSTVATGDITAFQYFPQPPFFIPAGSSADLGIVFDPPQAGRFAAAIAFENDRGLDLAVNVSGTATTEPLTVSLPTRIDAVVGDSVIIPMEVFYKLGSTYSPGVIEATLTHPADALAFLGLGAVAAPGWSLSATVPSPSTVVIRATHDGATPLQDGPFAQPVFQSTLSHATDYPIRIDVKTDASCVIPTGDTSRVTVTDLCFTDGRLVRMYGTNFSMSSPVPIPAQYSVRTEIGVGLPLPIQLDLFDATGRLMHTQIEQLPVGSRTVVTVGLDAVGPGSYTLRLISGPYSAVHPVIIVR